MRRDTARDLGEAGEVPDVVIVSFEGDGLQRKDCCLWCEKTFVRILHLFQE